MIMKLAGSCRLAVEIVHGGKQDLVCARGRFDCDVLARAAILASE
jgi:hypothetical protein